MLLEIYRCWSTGAHNSRDFVGIPECVTLDVRRDMSLPLPILTSRLIIRRPVQADMGAWVCVYQDSDVQRFLDGTLIRSAEEWWRGLEAISDAVTQPLSVISASTRQLIGQAGYLDSEPKGQCLEINCQLMRREWGHGYAQEICKALICVAFKKLGASRIVGYVHPENSASIGLMRKLGFRKSGLHVAPGKWQDGHIVYDIKRQSV